MQALKKQPRRKAMSFVRVSCISPYHRDYGLTDELRIRVIEDAVAMGVKRAAIKNNVHVASVYNWLRDYGVNQ
jgi:hypothetical protein